MNKIIFSLLFLFLTSQVSLSQEQDNHPKFPTKFFNNNTGFPTIPLWTKLTIELKENLDSIESYSYRILDMEPFEKLYSLEKDSLLFEQPLKENTIELYFMGAYYNQGEDDKDFRTVLMFKSAVKNNLDFKADIKYYFSEEFENTSIAGAYNGVKSTEIWHHKIDYIVLYDFRNYQF